MSDPIREVEEEVKTALIYLNRAKSAAINVNDYGLGEKLTNARAAAKSAWHYTSELELDDVSPRSPHQLLLSDDFG